MKVLLKKYLETHQNSIQNVQYLLLTVAAFLIILDIILASNGISGDTISEIVQSKTDSGLFAIVWIWGFLASHLFIIRKKRWVNELFGLGVLLVIAILIFFKHSDTVDFLIGPEAEKAKFEVSLIYIISGIILGYIFWPQLENE